MRRALASLALMLLTGCEAEKPVRPGDPVAPEQQGECEPSAANGKLPPRPTFRASELETLFDGARKAALVWAGWTGLGESTLDVEIALDAQAVAARPGCATYVELPALMTLASSDGLLELETPAIVAARSPARAALSVDLPHAELAGLHEQLASQVTQTADDQYPLELHLGADGLEGALRLREGRDAAACDVAAVPGPRLCPLGVRELPLDEPVLGLSPSALVSDFSSAGELPFGESLLSLAVELDGDRYCLEESVPDVTGMPSDRVRVGLAVRAHATTADQKLDVWLPARITLELDPDGRARDRILRGHAIVSADSTATFDIAAPDLAVVELSLQLEESGPQGSVTLHRLSPLAPDLVPQDISPACMKSPRLGDFVGIASGTW